MSRQLGNVKWYSIRKGYGFVTPAAGGDDVFIHRSSFSAPPAAQEKADGDDKAPAAPRVIVRAEQEVEFAIGHKDGKPMAIEITSKGGEALPAVQRRRKPKKKPQPAAPQQQQQQQPAAAKKKVAKSQGSTKFKVYLDPRSTCSRKVLLTLAEKELEFELEVVNIFKGEQKSEEHLARHPFGKVPFLEAINKGRSRPLFESVAICHYLSSFSSGEKLMPEDGWNQAVMMKMIAIINNSLWPALYPAVIAAVIEVANNPKAKPDQKKIAQSRKECAPILQIIEKEMRNSQFLAGRQFTLADVTAMPYFDHVANLMKDELAACPKLTKWWGEVSARPAWQAALKHTQAL